MKQRHSRRKRRGTALIELAISLPILFILVFGGIEIANAIFVQQFITEVSYHGTVEAMKGNAIEAGVVAKMNDQLQSRGIVNASVEIKGTDGSAFDTLPAGSPFFVQISLDHGENYAGPAFRQFFNLSATSTARRP